MNKKEEHNDFDKNIRNRVNSEQHVPPSHLWEKIEQDAKSYDDEGQEYLPLSWMRTSLYPHEISHSVDRPLKPSYRNRFLTAQLNNLGSFFPNLNSEQRLIPDSDIGLMRESLITTAQDRENSDQQVGHVPIDFWRDYGNTPEEGAYNYFTSPTEVRARLMELRTQGRYKDIYNPGFDKVDEAIYDKLPSNTKRQLEAYFTKDGIINMLNSISDANTIDTNIGMAATGGQVKKMQGGGPAPKDKDKQPVDLSLVESPPPSMSPVGGRSPLAAVTHNGT